MTTHSAEVDPGTRILRQMASARRFNRWMADTVRPFISEAAVLEIGAGTGNLTALLCAGCSRYLATDTDDDHLRELETRLAASANVSARVCDAARREHWLPFRGSFDTAVCINVLEHIPDDAVAIANLYAVLRPGGKAVVLVPHGAAAFGSLDEVLEHKRRYSRAELESKMRRAGFRVEQIIPFNRATYPAWIFNSRILRRRTFGEWQLRIFDWSVPVLRILDRYFPWPANSLIAVGAKDNSNDQSKHAR